MGAGDDTGLEADAHGRMWVFDPGDFWTSKDQFRICRCRVGARERFAAWRGNRRGWRNVGYADTLPEAQALCHQAAHRRDKLAATGVIEL